uniref:Uncharacterized protein n=1 Tax=Chromera velia CCMP2878 TaxID=1169474 RepID=A0A0G4HF00_9ALVE|eukprot:Cvel_6552.t1-p1 / transcript=Cvel_6552.t1 / gene=Cvel_6552 / organism=Chromera_velia_CCMP2878 / gene_product=hypothetical protein / transcript_product=hypothetical protein / location=Cvel_scaffold322:79342-82058(-) / protein_length=287 / sequence_SO=supercontig / SO=protein_coding / is_pseudo=false
MDGPDPSAVPLRERTEWIWSFFGEGGNKDVWDNFVTIFENLCSKDGEEFYENTLLPGLREFMVLQKGEEFVGRQDLGVEMNVTKIQTKEAKVATFLVPLHLFSFPSRFDIASFSHTVSLIRPDNINSAVIPHVAGLHDVSGKLFLCAITKEHVVLTIQAMAFAYAYTKRDAPPGLSARMVNGINVSVDERQGATKGVVKILSWGGKEPLSGTTNLGPNGDSRYGGIKATMCRTFPSTVEHNNNGVEVDDKMTQDKVETVTEPNDSVNDLNYAISQSGNRPLENKLKH